MITEGKILKKIRAYRAKNGTYPTIGNIASLKNRTSDVVRIILNSKRIDYTVPTRGEKSLLDDT